MCWRWDAAAGLPHAGLSTSWSGTLIEQLDRCAELGRCGGRFSGWSEPLRQMAGERTALAAERLDGDVCNDLVHVHVERGAGARLERPLPVVLRPVPGRRAEEDAGVAPFLPIDRHPGREACMDLPG